ncbi:MAG: DUF697 domain-containing protein [Bacteriovoracaceae bacterium]|nr:DUF697 domain-containing protein [Bacteriovoracaceae bacterium]
MKLLNFINKIDKEKLADEFFNIGDSVDDSGVGSKEDRANSLITQFSNVCAIVAIFPIPFADIIILTPIQIMLCMKVGKVYGFDIDKKSAKDILLELSAVVGLGFAAQHVAIGLYKTILPFMGAITTIPLVWSLTYVIGNLFKHYFIAKSEGKTLNKEQITEFYEKAKLDGEKLVKNIDVNDIKLKSKKLWKSIKTKLA